MRANDHERPDLLARLQAAGYHRGARASSRSTEAISRRFRVAGGWISPRGAGVVVEIDGGNLAAFSSGAGDGVYPSYWGLDGGASVLVTDFGLLRDDDEPDGDY